VGALVNAVNSNLYCILGSIFILLLKMINPPNNIVILNIVVLCASYQAGIGERFDLLNLFFKLVSLMFYILHFLNQNSPNL
jgi:hypothetical protein